MLEKLEIELQKHEKNHKGSRWPLYREMIYFFTKVQEARFLSI